MISKRSSTHQNPIWDESLILVDLPGFNYENKALAKQITDVAIGMFRQPNTSVLGFVKATENINSNVEIQHLLGLCQQNGVDLSRVMMIINKIDLQFSSWNSCRGDLDQFFFHDVEYDYFYTTLNPESESIDSMTFEEQHRFLSRLEDIEEQYVQTNILSRLGPMRQADIPHHFLLKNIKAKLSRILLSCFQQCVGDILMRLRSELERTKAKVCGLTAKLGKLRSLDCMVLDFVEQSVGLNMGIYRY